MGRIASTRSRRYLSVGVMSALLLVFSASQAYAQQEDSGEKAEAYYNKGVNAFFNKKYSLAITYFQRANALDPDAVVLYNISLAHSKLGNASDALSASLKAAEMGEMPVDTALKNNARIRAYQRILSAQATVDALVARAEAAQVKAPQASADGANQTSPSEAGLGALGWAGVGTAGVGAAALVGTGVLNYMLRDDLDAYERARNGGRYDEARDLQDTIDSRQSLGQIMLYSGAGLVVLGGALWAVDYFGGPEAQEPADTALRPALSGAVAPDGASVQAKWRF